MLEEKCCNSVAGSGMVGALEQDSVDGGWGPQIRYYPVSGIQYQSLGSFGFIKIVLSCVSPHATLHIMWFNVCSVAFISHNLTVHLFHCISISFSSNLQPLFTCISPQGIDTIACQG